MSVRFSSWMHPVTRRRLQRFRKLRRAWWSFWILAVSYMISLAAGLLCHDQPLLVKFEGRWFAPAFRFTSERDLLGEGHLTRVDFKSFVRLDRFTQDPANRVWWPLIPYGPREIVKPESLVLPEVVKVQLVPEPPVATVQVLPDWRVTRGVSAGYFFGTADGGEEGHSLAEGWVIPPAIREALAARWNNQAAPPVAAAGSTPAGLRVEFSLPPFAPRSAPPRSVRLTLRETGQGPQHSVSFEVGPDRRMTGTPGNLWSRLAGSEQEQVLDQAMRRFQQPVESVVMDAGAGRLRVRVDREVVRYPFRPVPGHPLGLDSAGRDVLARMLYGFRTAMTFGLLLTLVTLVLGTLFGALQGYYGGPVDLVGQRVIEIWDALPFLYILMLMGSVFGRSFSLLLLCYGLFNWVGISYYMRAEFLRLRRQPFVESARGLGLPGWKIMYRHILPNALVPLITFFPFALVSAIGTMAALDFLGFGLPPPTPSWGDLLAQAQEYGWAWWLALYPSLALFLVMLLGVFVGEGVRQAFDPKPYSRME